MAKVALSGVGSTGESCHENLVASVIRCSCGGDAELNASASSFSSSRPPPSSPSSVPPTVSGGSSCFRPSPTFALPPFLLWPFTFSLARLQLCMNNGEKSRGSRERPTGSGTTPATRRQRLQKEKKIQRQTHLDTARGHFELDREVLAHTGIGLCV